MDFQVGGFLFGYPITEYDGTTLTIRIPGNIFITVVPSDLPSNVTPLLQILGIYIPPQTPSSSSTDKSDK